MVKLGQDNLAHLKSGLSIDELPQTFIDAIKVARTLSIQYLWIDSLCIMQDSPSDWAKEAAIMSEVYKNSICNIGATVATNSSEGLFRRRDPNLVDTFRFRVDNRAFCITRPTLFWESISEAPLCKRGWVVQERWLCPRMLHFGEEQILWECRSAWACESVPSFTIHRDSFVSGKTGEGQALPDDTHGLERSGVMASTFGQPWNHLVATYTKADLTFDTDKLIAFSGLAKAFSEQQPNDEYLAGMWKDNFVAQMPWSVCSMTRHTKKRYTSYIAPSWSWASVNDVVRPFLSLSYRRLSVKQISSFIDCHLDYRDPFRKLDVVGGWVLIRGPLKEVRISKAHGDTHRNPVMQSWSETSSGEDTFPGSSEVWLDYEYTDEVCAERLYYLPLALTPDGRYEDKSFRETHGILIRSDSKDHGCFSRVGYSMVDSAEWAQTVVMRPPEIAELSELPFDVEKGYTVRLI
jgi:hypothetical protein